MKFYFSFFSFSITENTVQNAYPAYCSLKSTCRSMGKIGKLFFEIFHQGSFIYKEDMQGV
ncbi:unnamed protein product, partial [Larinioides sclopetarius]